MNIVFFILILSQVFACGMMAFLYLAETKGWFKLMVIFPIAISFCGAMSLYTNLEKKINKKPYVVLDTGSYYYQADFIKDKTKCETLYGDDGFFVKCK